MANDLAKSSTRLGGHILGVDIGGTRVRAAVADAAGRILVEAEIATDRRGSAVVDQLLALVAEVTERAGRRPTDLLAAVIGVPGVPDEAAGVVRHVPNVPVLEDPATMSSLATALPVAPHFENDVNLAALGEWYAGGHGTASLAALSLGTGIGLGIVINGALMRGEHGAAGEIAKLPFGADPFDASVSVIGALEWVVSTRALIDSYRGFGGRHVSTGREVFAAAHRGDASAVDAIDSYARNVARTVIAIRSVLDPGVIALGGGIGSDRYLHGCVAQWLRRAGVDPGVIVRSRLAARAGLIGALAAAGAHSHTAAVDGLVPETVDVVVQQPVTASESSGKGLA